MKILITGANGFVGKNLVAELKNQGYNDLLLCDRDTTETELKQFALEADFVYHLAGVNRPKEETEFEIGNKGFTEELLTLLSQNPTPPPVVFSSSAQAELSNPYGISKKEAESLVISYGEKQIVDIKIYRFPNLFGKWCKPNYNSVVATFCHNISRHIPIQVNDEKVELTLAYIDDVIAELIKQIEYRKTKPTIYGEVRPCYKVSLGNLVTLLTSFKESRDDLSISNMNNPFIKKLYSTYLSYLPEDQFSYELTMHKDQRGSFTEFIRTPDRGQVSVNISKPGITKGNHWHHTKNEKFLVVSGRGVIRFRKVDSEEVIEYAVSGDKLEVVDIPVGYTHNIENLGDTEMVTIMWVNEPFDPSSPDTYYLEV
ncbi:SDR family oxidoreductase [Exiguobacterium sp. SH1S21]|uniref:polysaccharide biosynthesis C-terminal domain-containing protein n=1 Tax=Exiguobacterium sp. SH1S21 TaxID=2510953 RepID=UPI001039A5A4|nr:NAD-dependent epimerase/dehydratase family protein [Exiguobacterium sp. SH1S21]TCI57451.1 SDR family oxidoreductase [Exiguobacterium sp. SH1S21]